MGYFCNMSILVVAATPLEIEPFLTAHRTQEYPNTDVLVSGIGLVATTFALTSQVRLKRPQLIIQAGIAGCFNNTIPTGTVLAIQKDRLADQGVEENRQFKDMFDLGLVKRSAPPFQNGWLVNPLPLRKITGLRSVKAISVNTITTSQKMTSYYTTAFQPVTESMEGAALHYVCLREQIPFIQLRAVSNYIGERNKKKWNFIDSIKNLNKTLQELLSSPVIISTLQS